MKSRPRILLAALVSAALLTTGCGALEDGGDSDQVTIAAGFYPLAWVAEQIAGDRAEVVNLTKAGQEPHDSGLSIDKTADLASADLVLVSQGFQPEVDAAAEENAQGTVLDAIDVIELLPAGEHSHEEHEGEEHDHGDQDPHFWLDPLRMADLGDAVAVELADIDPAHAEEYEDAARRLRDELVTLDQEYAEGLASCARSTVVVSHDAFGYLRRYGLTFEPIAGLSPDAEPTPAHLQDLQRLIRKEGVTTVFSEALDTSALAESLADDLGVRTDTLDPIEGLADPDSGEDYLSLMRNNLAALERANGC